MTSTTDAREFVIRNVKLRSVSFNAPAVPALAPDVLNAEKVKVEVSAHARRGRNPELYEVALILDVRATDDGGDHFRAVVEEVGVFRVVGYPEEEAMALLRSKGAGMLYPYAREMVLSMVGRCGINQLGLQPLGFDMPVPGRQAAG